MDGWILTHSYERVAFLSQDAIDGFLPSFAPENFLDVENPKTWGSYAEENVLMEMRYSIQQAMQYGKRRIKEIFSELAILTGRDHGGLIEAYRTEDADIVLVAMGSVAGTIKDAVDQLRESGKRVGLVKLRCYRPFPHEDIYEAVKAAKALVVLDANFSMGSEGAVGMDLKAKLCGRPGAPRVFDFIAGLGGREVNIDTVDRIVKKAEEFILSETYLPESYWMDLNPDILP
jgi:pyruvate ferredoxin oxidoreductase alpha subunit